MADSIIRTGNRKQHLGNISTTNGWKKDNFGLYKKSIMEEKENIKKKNKKNDTKIKDVPIKYETSKREDFYTELVILSRNSMSDQQRKKYIEKMKEYYKSSALSENTIMKVFDAYSYCTISARSKSEKEVLIKKNIQVHLQKLKVDARVIAKLIGIENGKK